MLPSSGLKSDPSREPAVTEVMRGVTGGGPEKGHIYNKSGDMGAGWRNMSDWWEV
jgi:hypothetical protein